MTYTNKLSTLINQQTLPVTEIKVSSDVWQKLGEENLHISITHYKLIPITVIEGHNKIQLVVTAINVNPAKYNVWVQTESGWCLDTEANKVSFKVATKFCTENYPDMVTAILPQGAKPV